MSNPLLLMFFLVSGLGSGLLSSCSEHGPLGQEDGNDRVPNLVIQSVTGIGGILAETESSSRRSLETNFDSYNKGKPLATSACQLSTVRGTCSSNVLTSTFPTCTVLNGTLFLAGSWTNTYNDEATCLTHRTSGILSDNADTLTRTTSNFAVISELFQLGTSTNSHTTYDSTTLPRLAFSGVRITRISASERQLTIGSLRRILRTASNRIVYDQSLETDATGLSVTGSRQAGSRSVSGTVVVYHNTASYKATTTYNSVRWESNTCCYPTSGSVSMALTGSGTTNGNANLAFRSCGLATYTDVNGAASNVRLDYCEEN